MTTDELLALAERVERLTSPCLKTDVAVELALFEPYPLWIALRGNAAGTKVIATDLDGKETTHWPNDWTLAHRRKDTAAALRALAAIGKNDD